MELPALECLPTAPRGNFITLDRNRQEIRIASLLPGRWDDPICCMLSIYSLKQSCPRYEALSYVWEAEPGFQQISLDGKPFLATTNLFLALRRLRKANEKLKIWVDALCINQKDLVEKSHQVALMGDIYRHCSRVYCWLGDYTSEPGSSWIRTTIEEAIRIGLPWDEPDASTYSEVFDSGLAAFSFISELSRGAHLSEFGFSIKYEYGERQNEFENYSGFESVTKLFESSWWSRIWVIQETILPPEALMVYGSMSTTWKRFLRASRAIDAHTRGCCYSTFRVMAERHRFLLQRIRALIQELEASRQELAKRKTSPFRELLCRYRGRKASDSRDMVYALMGLATDIDSELGLQPDYSLPKQHVYEKITMFSLRMERKLYMLEMYRNPKPDIPSWIYDWSEPLNQTGWMSWLAERTRLAENRGLYKASLDTICSPSETLTHKLSIDGIYVDQVVKVGDCCTMDHYDTSWKQVLRAWEKMSADRFHGKVPGEHSRTTGCEDAFWRTMMCDIAFDTFDAPGKRASLEDKKSFFIWWSKFVNNDDTMYNDPINDEQRLMSSFFYRCITSSVFTSIFGRSYFLTKCGYMGLGNPKVGDQVWILFGGDVPFILRPSLDSLNYCLIGGCYVQGIMDGEAMEDDVGKKQAVLLS